MKCNDFKSLNLKTRCEIESCPIETNQRSEISHYEVDLVMGKVNFQARFIMN